MAFSLNNMEGKELADDYTRKTLPKGRWSDTWDIFKSNFTKLILLNLFVLITFLPGIAIIIFRNMYYTGLGAFEPVNSSIKFFFYPDLNGRTESVALTVDVLFYALLIVAGFIASLGIAGGTYSLRKLINTRGEFTVKGFLHGIKKCYFNTVLPVTLFMVFLYGTVIVGDWRALHIATGGSKGGATTAYVFSIIGTVLIGIYCAWLFAAGTTYKLGLGQLIKNSFVLMIGAPVHTLFMAGFSLIPVWLFLMGSFFRTLGIILMIFFGFAFVLLSWTSFTQWVFDLYITPNLKTEDKQRNVKKTEKELAQEKLDEEKRQAMELLAAGRSELIARPILPVSDTAVITPFGKTFTRENLSAANSERDKLKSDIAEYEKAHLGDEVYVQYNKLFADREKALQTPEGKKGKKNKSKVSSDNLLK